MIISKLLIIFLYKEWWQGFPFYRDLMGNSVFIQKTSCCERQCLSLVVSTAAKVINVSENILGRFATTAFSRPMFYGALLPNTVNPVKQQNMGFPSFAGGSLYFSLVELTTGNN